MKAIWRADLSVSLKFAKAMSSCFIVRQQEAVPSPANEHTISPLLESEMSFSSLHRHRQRRLFAELEHAPVAGELGGRPHCLHRVVGELDRGSPIGRHHLADDGEGVEAPVGSQ